MHDVTVYGTANFLKIPGVEYCAKTGTAQNPHGKDHSIFTCFAPKDNPTIAVAVVVENAGFGSTWAGPIATLLMEKYLNDTISAGRSTENMDRVSKADLIPAAIKHWYYVKDSIRGARLAIKEVSVDTVLEQPAVVPKKTTLIPKQNLNERTVEKQYLKKLRPFYHPTIKTIRKTAPKMRNNTISKGIDWSIVILYTALVIIGLLMILQMNIKKVKVLLIPYLTRVKTMENRRCGCVFVPY
jgi:hypothetical protein